MACISCHSPELVFTNGKDTAAEGVGPGNRNVPSMVLASHARWQLWDGRADSLWAQAVLPFEDATEFGSSRLFVAHAVFDRHRSEYEPIFGPLPPLDDAGRFPASGKPGDAAWETMLPADQEAVTRVLANVGKSIAACLTVYAGARPQAASRTQPAATPTTHFHMPRMVRRQRGPSHTFVVAFLY